MWTAFLRLMRLLSMRQLPRHLRHPYSLIVHRLSDEHLASDSFSHKTLDRSNNKHLLSLKIVRIWIGDKVCPCSMLPPSQVHQQKIAKDFNVLWQCSEEEEEEEAVEEDQICRAYSILSTFLTIVLR